MVSIKRNTVRVVEEGVAGAGRLTASGLIAQAGVNNTGLTASIDAIPEPTSALLVALGLAGFAARRRVA